MSDIEKRIDPPKVTIFEGKSGKFNCFSNRQVSWKFNGSSLPSNTRVDKFKKLSIDNWLYVNNAKLNNSGIFTCSVKYMGKNLFSEDAILDVRRKPSIY